MSAAGRLVLALAATFALLVGAAAAQDQPDGQEGAAATEAPGAPGAKAPGAKDPGAKAGGIGKVGGKVGLGKTLTGLAVMRLRETQTLGQTEIADLDIRIEAEGAFDHSRRLMRYVKRTDGVERSLIRFTEPPAFVSLAALTIEAKEGNDDQWLYIPDIRKIKRVPRAETTENFAGTGFTFEDLRSEDLDAHRYKTLKKVELQGRSAFEIEATPIPGKVRALAGYAKRHIFVDAERWVELRIDFYDADGKYLKTQENLDWRPVGDIYRPYKVLMREPSKKRTTWIKFRSWTANEELSDELFTTRELVREDH